MNHDNRREILAEYLDQRIILTGVFDRLATNKNPHKPFKVALLQDVEVELSKAKHDLGHVWVQHAETLAEFQHGDRIRCSCRVGKYQRTLTVPDGDGFTVKTDYSLAYPSEAKLLSRAVAFRAAPEQNGAPPAAAAPPPPQEETARAADPLQLILEVKQLAEQVGGCERLLEFMQAVARVGGWERALQVQGIAETVGGWDRLEQLLSLLKL
jgi:hypothetical protein